MFFLDRERKCKRKESSQPEEEKENIPRVNYNPCTSRMFLGDDLQSMAETTLSFLRQLHIVRITDEISKKKKKENDAKVTKFITYNLTFISPANLVSLLKIITGFSCRFPKGQILPDIPTYIYTYSTFQLKL